MPTKRLTGGVASRRAVLRVTVDEVVLSLADREIRARHSVLDGNDQIRLAEWIRVRQAGLEEIGSEMGHAFLGGDAGRALADELRVARRTGSVLRLAVQVDNAILADLPWETLTLPGEPGPLVLDSLVRFHRRVGLADPPAVSAIPGPLRVLAVIASPDVGAGDLLDYERELQSILDAVDPARTRQTAFVRVLNWGSLVAIRQELSRHRFHILHLSCHAMPGRLILEASDGGADEVDAGRFIREALVPGSGVPLVVLAGCSTALSDRRVARMVGADRLQHGEAALPGFAIQLLEHGVPSVLAMTAPVSDHYATRLAADMYEQLAQADFPEPLTALTRSRQRLEEARTVTERPEWATPALFLRGRPVPFFDRAEREPVDLPSKPSLGDDVRTGRVGEFVGRRRELRAVLRDLRSPAFSGVVIQGVAGAGKSALATEAVSMLDARDQLVVVLSGRVTVEDLLGEIARRLYAAQPAGTRSTREIRRLASSLSEAGKPWQDRLAQLHSQMQGIGTVLLVLDGAEHNLVALPEFGWEVADEDLAGFLRAWLSSTALSLLLTCRYDFPFPNSVGRPLAVYRLEPLSFSETRKLIWRLPAVDNLPAKGKRDAYEYLGGHPRALEYFEELLRDGHPDALGKAAVRLTEDSQLQGLLDQLGSVPLTRPLITGASVYRRAVDITGLAVHVSDRDCADRLTLRWPPPEGCVRAVQVLLASGLLTPTRPTEPAAHAAGTSDDPGLGYVVHRWLASALAKLTAPDVLAEAHSRAAAYWQQRAQALASEKADPVGALLEVRFHLHRCGDTDGALIANEEACRELHVRGDWSREQQLFAEALEWVAADARDAAVIQHALGLIAQERGDYAAAMEFYRAALEIFEDVDDQSSVGAACHQLGRVLAQTGSRQKAKVYLRRAAITGERIGNLHSAAASLTELALLAETERDYLIAELVTRRALDFLRRLRDDAGIAGAHAQLSVIAHGRGNPVRTEVAFREAVDVTRRITDRARAAKAFHRLGMTSIMLGRNGDATTFLLEAEARYRQLGNEPARAGIYYEMGLARDIQKDRTAALQYYRAALDIFERIGDYAGASAAYAQIGQLANNDSRDSLARGLLSRGLTAADRAAPVYSAFIDQQLGLLAQRQADHADAEDRQLRAAETFREAGSEYGELASYLGLAMAAEDRADDKAAERYYYRAISICETIGNEAVLAVLWGSLGQLYTDRGDPEQGVPFTLAALDYAYRQDRSMTSKCIRSLQQQAQALGALRFSTVVARHAEPRFAAVVRRLLERDDDSDETPTSP